MSKENFFLGYPSEFKKICLVYPPKIKEIIDNKDLGIYQSILLVSQEDIIDLYTEKNMDLAQVVTPLEYVFSVALSSEEMFAKVKQAFEFFIHENVTLVFDSKMILIGNPEEELSRVKSVDSLRYFNEDNFFEFQNCLREACGTEAIEPYNSNEPEKLKEMKAKQRKRDKLKAKHGNGLDLFSMMSSICCMGVNINPLNIGELTQVAVNELFRRYQEKEKYELDIKSLLAGADSKKVKPKNWIRKLDKE